MMPPGRPVDWSQTARAAQAYAYALLRGASKEQAEQAATVHNPAASLPDVIAMATAARAAARTLDLRDPAWGQVYAAELAGASTPGATTVVYSVAVERELRNGTHHWTTIQPQLPAGSSYEDALAEIQRLIDRLGTPEGGDTGGTVVQWEIQTVIGHTPGGP